VFWKEKLEEETRGRITIHGAGTQERKEVYSLHRQRKDFGGRGDKRMNIPAVDGFIRQELRRG